MQSNDFSNYEDDDFDDQFDSADMSGSGFAASGAKPAVNIKNVDVSTSKGKTGNGYELVDFNVSASASMLPPLAGGQRPVADVSGSNQFGRLQSNPKPEDFQINLADSQPSLDFDISGSVGTGLGSRLGKSNK